MYKESSPFLTEHLPSSLGFSGLRSYCGRQVNGPCMPGRPMQGSQRGSRGNRKPRFWIFALVPLPFFFFSFDAGSYHVAFDVLGAPDVDQVGFVRGLSGPYCWD